jgi:hypothetical protein
MLKMDQVHVVRHKVLIEKLSQRQVVLDIGLSRNTVAKYLSIPAPQRFDLKPNYTQRSEDLPNASLPFHLTISSSRVSPNLVRDTTRAEWNLAGAVSVFST